MIKLILVFVWIFNFTSLFAQDATEIVKKADELMRAKSSYTEITMNIVKPDWSREMGMKVWALEPDYSIIYITDPARDKGTVTLKRKTEVWNWLPSAQKVIKIPPSMMLQSWMGSDFTNDDLLKQSSIVVDYTHKIIGDDKIEERDCWIVELIPKPDAPVVWGKIVLYITKENYLELKAEFYDETLQLINTMIGSNVKNVGDREIPTKMEMSPADKPGNKTIFEYSEIEFNVSISADFFSKQNMKRIK